MAETTGKRDENRVTVAMAMKSDDSGVGPILIDSVTGRVLMDIIAE